MWQHVNDNRYRPPPLAVVGRNGVPVVYLPILAWWCHVEVKINFSPARRKKIKRKEKIPEAGDAFTSRGPSSGLLLQYSASGVNGKKSPSAWPSLWQVSTILPTLNIYIARWLNPSWSLPRLIKPACCRDYLDAWLAIYVFAIVPGIRDLLPVLVIPK